MLSWVWDEMQAQMWLWIAGAYLGIKAPLWTVEARNFVVRWPVSSIARQTSDYGEHHLSFIAHKRARTHGCTTLNFRTQQAPHSSIAEIKGIVCKHHTRIKSAKKNNILFAILFTSFYCQLAYNLPQSCCGEIAVAALHRRVWRWISAPWSTAWKCLKDGWHGCWNIATGCYNTAASSCFKLPTFTLSKITSESAHWLKHAPFGWHV